ncbi:MULTISPECIES: TetR/AcrR family transcriptional regulator C-terminal domain-containing protein [unclassified Streptomyces]|uniref:TetR/AcrR family transcriptional regulator C-terminal domain-containing protein n=1 Tax=unclassified Streptomyces TaxID=2593676 RepID=UPI002E3182A3|nr:MULTISPECIES: TetR/AcrR family transcriptional regulator C-terminal domain-containing protein [unclassified Streptomyces]WUC63409.1 TetR/AcrR family transcriptional regulator C-terminal domain-containing protein [Streptomyces sp. NBC_00539]
MAERTGTARRSPLNRDRVLRVAVALADDTGIEGLSMRKLAQELGVVPMALYKHVAGKEELLDGMVDVVVGGIDDPPPGTDWKDAVRNRILSARSALRGHAWASQVLRSRSRPTPAVLAHLDSVIGTFRAGGLSVDLTHHVMHALGSRVLGFTQELYDTPPPQPTPPDPGPAAEASAAAAARYPHVTELARAVAHDQGSVVGQGCDDQFEFEFALDLLLDGFEKLHKQGWKSTNAGGTRR